MANIRLLTAQEARAAIPALSEILCDCIEGGASVGFMQPYGIADAEAYWRDVADAVERAATLLFVAEIENEMVGTVQVGFAQMPNQPPQIKQCIVATIAFLVWVLALGDLNAPLTELLKSVFAWNEVYPKLLLIGFTLVSGKI